MKNVEAYEGSALQYIRQVILPQMPNVQMISEYHLEIKNYLKDKEANRFIRKYSKFPLRGVLYQDHGKQFFSGDNEMPLWIYLNCLHQITPDVKYWLNEQVPPISFVKDNGAIYLTVGRQKDAKFFAEKGWKHSHLLEAAPKEVISLDARMVRYIHPLNHFPSPSVRHWSFRPSFYRNDVGEDPRFIQLVWHELYAKYKDYPGYSVMFKEFLIMAEALVDTDNPPIDFKFTIRPKVKSEKAVSPDVLTEQSAVSARQVKSRDEDGQVDFLSHSYIDKTIKGFRIQKSWIGKGYRIKCTFTRGKMKGRSVVYDHDSVYNYSKEHLNQLPSFHNTGMNADSNNVPGYARPHVQRLDT
jgi:hypothetical protein